MGGLFAVLQRFGIARVIAVLGAAAGAIAVVALVVFHVGGEPESLLYSNLDMKEASQITAALSQANIKYESKGDGSVIMVPRDKVGTARLMLASKGLPTSGSVGYEIFDNTSALGQTDFVQNLNRQRALEGELARTITSLRGVSSARVHLVLPKRELFEEEAAPPTASIVVGVTAGQLSGEEVQSLRNLVAGAVPNLKPEKVTVVDETGRMLAAGSEDGDFTSSLASDRRTEAEERLRKAIKDVVEGVVGVGKARVQVTADLDLNRVTTQEEKYDPDGQVVLSTSTGAEKSQDNSSNPTSGASAASNIPGQGQAGGGGSSSQGNSNDKNEETTNYVISKTTTTQIKDPGAIKRLSVAVAVDGVSTTSKGGKTTYAPRSAEEMQHIQDLVRAAMGFDQTRGDQMSVVNVRFNRETDAVGGTEAKAGMFNFDKNDIMRGAELFILFLVGVLMIFFVLRPIMKSAGGALPALVSGGPGLAGGGPYVGAQTAQLAFAGDAGGGGHLALAAPDHGIDIARIEGQVKVSSIKKVADFVDKHPEESVSILRGWLHEG